MTTSADTASLATAVTELLQPHNLTPADAHDILRRVGSRYGISLTGGNNTIKTHCRRGHPYNEANTYWPPTGGRHCRACVNARSRARQRRLREERHTQTTAA